MSPSIQDFLDLLPHSEGALAEAAQKNKAKRIKSCHVECDEDGDFLSIEIYFDDEPPIEAYYDDEPPIGIYFDDEPPIEAYYDDEPPIEAYYDDEPPIEVYYDDEPEGFDEVEESQQAAVSLLPQIPLDHVPHPELIRRFIAFGHEAGFSASHWCAPAREILNKSLSRP